MSSGTPANSSTAAVSSWEERSQPALLCSLSCSAKLCPGHPNRSRSQGQVTQTMSVRPRKEGIWILELWFEAVSLSNGNLAEKGLMADAVTGQVAHYPFVVYFTSALGIFGLLKPGFPLFPSFFWRHHRRTLPGEHRACAISLGQAPHPFWDGWEQDSRCVPLLCQRPSSVG